MYRSVGQDNGLIFTTPPVPRRPPPVLHAPPTRPPPVLHAPPGPAVPPILPGDSASAPAAGTSNMLPLYIAVGGVAVIGVVWLAMRK